MKKTPLQIRNQLRIRHPLTLVVLVFCLAFAGYLAYRTTRPNTAYQAPLVNGQTPTPAPGQAGNPGDVSKEQQGQAISTPSPSPRSGSMVVTEFNVTPQTDGTVRVQNDQITGATSGTCTLKLTSPSGVGRATSGQLLFSGTYYSCSFSTISGVTDKGAWRASLSVASGTGATGAAPDTTFEVN